MNLKLIISVLFFFFFSNKIVPATAQSEEQLEEFSYGNEEFKLAIIGDSGSDKEANEVMELSDFDALLHLGDFDYRCMPDKYFNDVLDSDRTYQFMGVLGNHDAKHQCPDDVAEKFKNNVYNEMTGSKNDKVKCEFSESKFMWSCVYQNMRIIGLTPGVNGAEKRREQLSFLKEHLENATEDWKICSWHFYDKYYHTGKYPQYGNIVSGDEGGESFYDYCKDHGAIIFSAHDHVYARTNVMSKFSTPEIDVYDKNTESNISQIRNGATLNILNGAGGWEMYIEQGEQKDYKHWVKKYAKGDNRENEKKYGGLFCQFNYGGNNKRAHCKFLRINSSEKVFDSFDIYRNDDPENVPYQQIDEDFLNEKIKAYREANNISNDNNDNNNYKNENIESNGINFINNKKVFNKTTISIGGSVVAALAVAGVAVFAFRKYKNSKLISHNEPELVIDNPTIKNKNKNINDVNNNVLAIPNYINYTNDITDRHSKNF
eukprot:jgi/Orpsp1_1/1182775/evm.model.c7180000082622.1